MERIVFIISDFIIPAVMILWGIRHRKNYPPKPVDRGAYRSKRAQRTKKSWVYAQKRFAQLWIVFGCIVLIINLIIRFTLPLEDAMKTLINLIPSGLGMLMPYILVERELKQKVYDRIDQSEKK